VIPTCCQEIFWPATVLDNSCKKSMLCIDEEKNGSFHKKHDYVFGTPSYREGNGDCSLEAIIRKISNKDNE
jgi:hypothetical protein